MIADTQNSTIAVTGATGFVGRHVLSVLDGRGYKLRLLTRRALPEPVAEKASIITGDLGDADALARLTEGADAVLHLAGAISAPGRQQFFTVNEEGTRRLAVQAQRAGIRRFVHMSSLAARQPELSDYAASKRAAEDGLDAVSGAMDVAIIRAPAVYGPGDRATLPLIQQLTGRFALIPSSVTSRFSLIYVKDLARIAVAALEEDWTGRRDADDGEPPGYGWADLAAAVSTLEDHAVTPVFLPRPIVNAAAWLLSSGASAIGRSAMITPGKVRELYHDDWVSRERVLRADAPTPLPQGLARTLAWYRRKGWLRDRPSADRNRLREGGVKFL
ncbi:MAG: NAD-dependent epimerase/dehydratase family protein [Rhizobiales bacterium]|nr:NAD-dependent epimerase/dehydratase family protein [Hyphomicrobiales bacterium]